MMLVNEIATESCITSLKLKHLKPHSFPQFFHLELISWNLDGRVYIRWTLYKIIESLPGF